MLAEWKAARGRGLESCKGRGSEQPAPRPPSLENDTSLFRVGSGWTHQLAGLHKRKCQFVCRTGVRSQVALWDTVGENRALND